MDLRTRMLSIKELSPTAPAYMAWLQERVDACKHKQSGDVDENRSVDENEKVDAPEKGSVPWKKYPTGAIPSPIDNSHLKKNPPRPLAPSWVALAGARSGVVGKDYRASLTTDATSPLEWTTVSGALPPGLNLSTRGGVYGTPTTPGTYSFTVKVDNDMGSVTKALTIVITAQP